MLDELLKSPLFDERVLSKLAQLHKFILAQNIWQHTLLSSSSFGSKMQEYQMGRLGDRELRIFSRYGIIKTDCIFLNLDRQFDYLLSIKRCNGDKVYLFTDIEDASKIDIAHLYLLDEKNEEPIDYQLYFHPYRIYGVNHLFGLTKRSVVPYQPFLDIDGLKRVNRKHEEEIESDLKSDNIWRHVKFYNTLIDFCIVSEVAFHSFVLQKISWSKTYEETVQLIDELRASLKDIYKMIGLDTIELLRDWLVTKAEHEDSNVTVHALLRMMKSNERLHLKGKLGLSMLFLEMAEILRRAAEFYFEKELNEENKVRGKWYFDWFMKEQFGTVRILDDPLPKTEFIRFLGLDYTLRAKIYVEGITEYGFLEEIFAGTHAIQIINLGGLFVEGKRKGINFRESLQEDQRLHLFSFVLLDADRQDNVRVLKKAVLDGYFFGIFLISEPDFECGNFSPVELYTAFCNHHKFEKDFKKFKAEMDHIKSGKDFFNVVNRLHNQKLNKSKEWGKALGKFVYQSPQKKHRLFKFVQQIITSLQCGYERHKQIYKVDPDTGTLTEK